MYKSSPLISVIIPTYNYAQFLDDALNSVLKQNIVNDIEIIIIDDGSTDNTAEVVKPFLSCNLKYIYQKNAGLSAARNTGIQASKGRLIQFLDADDMLGKYALSGRLKVLHGNPDISVAVCRTKIFRSSAKGRPDALLLEGWPIYTRHLDIHLCNFNIAPPHAFLLRRDIIDHIGWFDPNLSACEDYDFWLRVLFQGFKFMFCSHGIVYYRRHKASMSQNLLRQRTFDAILHQKLQQLLMANHKLQYQPEILMAFISGILCTCMRFAELNSEPPKDLFKAYQWAINEIMKLDYYQDSFLTYFYFLQSLLILKDYPDHIPWTDNLKNKFLDMIPNFNFIGNKFKLFQNAINYLFFYRDADFFERYRLAKYTFQLIFT
jgi:glycosyltransferase involved in cell wall biosynthesis